MRSGKRNSKSFATREEAEEWLISQSEVDKDVLKEYAANILLADYLVKWLEGRKTEIDYDGNVVEPTERADKEARDALRGKKKIAPTTYEGYRIAINKHILPRLPKRLRLIDVKRKHMENLLTSCMVDKIGGRTTQVVRNLLHKALEDARSDGLITINPTQDLQASYESEERKIPTRAQVARLLHLALETRYFSLLYLALASGLRQAEIFGLIWSDYDTETQTISVSRQGIDCGSKGRRKHRDRQTAWAALQKSCDL
jgi:integrase